MKERSRTTFHSNIYFRNNGKLLEMEDYTRGWSTLSGPSMATLLKTTGQTCSIILCFTIFAMSKAFDFIFRQHPALGICLRWGLFMKHEFYTTVTLVLADATSAVSKSMKIRDWLCESDWDPIKSYGMDREGVGRKGLPCSDNIFQGFFLQSLRYGSCELELRPSYFYS
ncbi:hypothetical protein FOCC_FOCC015258 [Frankliniella occidentalis]|nr:hypothetical protein FOCC_FOCC015258 [Frankliniella occidentalis]